MNLGKHIKDRLPKSDLYQNAKALKKDKALQAWFDKNLKGKSSLEMPKILDGGVEKGEISEEQGQIIFDLLMQVYKK